MEGGRGAGSCYRAGRAWFPGSPNPGEPGTYYIVMKPWCSEPFFVTVLPPVIQLTFRVESPSCGSTQGWEQASQPGALHDFLWGIGTLLPVKAMEQVLALPPGECEPY